MSHFKLHTAHVASGLPARGVMSTAITGTIAAGLTAGSAVWTYRNPEASTGIIYVDFLRPLTFTITAFATPVTLGRALNLVRLTPDAPGTSNPTGGAAFTAVQINSAGAAEEVGVGRIATTGALTITGFTASASLRTHYMAFAGGANNGAVNVWAFGAQENSVAIHPGECLALVAHQTFDASGTFHLLAEMSATHVVSA